MVTDFDCWHPDHDHVQVADIVRVLLDNAEKAKTLVTMIAPRLKKTRPEVCPAGCDRALEHALITAPAARSGELVAKLDAVAGRVLKQ
jgi:5'-methylthioadenosine phosphorylase